MIFFEDTRLGERHTLGSFTFTAEAIKAFARDYDPQAFHLDEEAGRQSLFGGLAASGWHTASVYMKLLVADLEAGGGGGRGARRAGCRRADRRRASRT